MEKFKIQICLKISILRMKISTYSYVRIFILSTPNIHDPKISKIRKIGSEYSKWNSNSSIRILLVYIHRHSKFEQIRNIESLNLYRWYIYISLVMKLKRIFSGGCLLIREKDTPWSSLLYTSIPPYTPRRSPSLSRNICFELVREGKERENALSDRLPVEKSSQVSTERFCKTSPRTTPHDVIMRRVIAARI